jgi:hypothetical protein
VLATYDRVHLQVAEPLAPLNHCGPLIDAHPVFDDASAVLGRASLAVALTARAQALVQVAAALLVLPDMLIDAPMGDHVAARAHGNAHDLLRAELLGQLPFHLSANGSGEAHRLGLVLLALRALAGSQVSVLRAAALVAVAPDLAAHRRL